MYTFLIFGTVDAWEFVGVRVNNTGWTAWEWDYGIADMIEIPMRIAFFCRSF
jgi:hypothetical protein